MKSGKFSGEAAWQHLKSIGSQPHGYNSDANLHIRQFIVDVASGFRSLAALKGLPKDYIQILKTDPVNLTTWCNFWYESNNVIVRVRGSQSLRSVGKRAETGKETSPNSGKDDAPALLVSAHYDSTPVSHGVTDDGIAVAVMLEMLRTLIYNPPLKYDVIFNFNNAEELGLNGAQAFIQHPLFKNVKGFVNLEGTGVAAGKRSLLFRTNSMSMSRAFGVAAKYPHASVITNDIMRFIRRYLYHTPRDDLDHVTPLSVQHMGDNLFHFVKHLCNDTDGDNTLETLQPVEETDDPLGPLPLAGFFFLDILGFYMVVLTQNAYIALSTAVFGIVVGMVVWKVGFQVWRWRQHSEREKGTNAQGLWKMYFGPAVVAISLVFTSVVIAFAGVLGLSILKAKLNKYSSYGHPELNLFWVLFSVLFFLFISVTVVFPRLCRLFGVKYGGTICGFNLAAVTRLRNGSVDESGGRTSDSSSESEEEESDDHSGESSEPGETTAITGTPEMQLVVLPLPLQWALLLVLWGPLSVLGAYAAWKGVDSAYIFVEWGVFGALSVVFAEVVQIVSTAKASKEERARSQSSEPIQTSNETWILMSLLQLLVSSAIPVIHTIDLVEMMVIGFPSLIAEGLPETIFDVAFGFLGILMFANAVPVFCCGYFGAGYYARQKGTGWWGWWSESAGTQVDAEENTPLGSASTRSVVTTATATTAPTTANTPGNRNDESEIRTRSVSRISFLILTIVLLPLLILHIASCIVFPFSRDRPAKLMFMHIWDVTPSEESLQSKDLPPLQQQNTTDADLSDILSARNITSYVVLSAYPTLNEDGLRSVTAKYLPEPVHCTQRKFGLFDECVFGGQGVELPDIADFDNEDDGGDGDGQDGGGIKSPSDLIEVYLEDNLETATVTSVEGANTSQSTRARILRGRFVGSPGSRICKVSVVGYPFIETDSVIKMLRKAESKVEKSKGGKDAQQEDKEETTTVENAELEEEGDLDHLFGVWLEVEKLDQWVLIDGSKPSRPESPFITDVGKKNSPEKLVIQNGDANTIEGEQDDNERTLVLPTSMYHDWTYPAVLLRRDFPPDVDAQDESKEVTKSSSTSKESEKANRKRRNGKGHPQDGSADERSWSSQERIQSKFAIRFGEAAWTRYMNEIREQQQQGGQTQQPASVMVECFHPEVEASPVYRRLAVRWGGIGMVPEEKQQSGRGARGDDQDQKAGRSSGGQLPEWITFAASRTNRFGGVSVRKRVRLPL
ncbi:hypothetical protein HK102_002420 [Quaeritorhiza haematococci]|nr:hypothetical protein HK102_002420 [Quaeritorhiza haematococci]